MWVFLNILSDVIQGELRGQVGGVGEERAVRRVREGKDRHTGDVVADGCWSEN